MRSTPATMLTCLPEVLGSAALQPVYDASLARLVARPGRPQRNGMERLRARAVFDGGNAESGGTLHYVQAGDVSEVVQIAAPAWFVR